MEKYTKTEFTDEFVKHITEIINNKINNDSDQGIFKEPYGIPNGEHRQVIYMRYATGGMQGGSCWGDEARPYTTGAHPGFIALDIVLKELCPNISFMQYKEIEHLIQSNEETHYEYYGNSTDYVIEYIPVEELLNYLRSEDIII